MTDQDALVVFTPSGRRGRFPHGTNLLDAARRLGVDLDSVCGGRGICGRCQVVPAEGAFPKHGITSDRGNLSPFSDPERTYDERKGLAPGRRLGCHATVLGDLLIDVPPDSHVHRQVVRKEADAREIELDPVVSLHYVEVAEPDLATPRSDARRLLDALAEQWDLDGLAVDPVVLPTLQRTLRAGGWTVTAAVHDGATVTAVWPGLHDRVVGIAFDVGSTTVAGHLCDLHTGEVLASVGVMNPQIRFGEDLMSRVSYVMMHPEGAGELTTAIRDCLRDLVTQLLPAADGLDREPLGPDDVVEVTIVGNPIMHHLVLGLDPTELGGAPFALATDQAVRLAARELGIGVAAGAGAYLLPCIAGHVGADAAGVILAEAPHERDELTLIVDVGTNAEIVLGNRHRLFAASSPTGPAFEGAQISSGQRAAPGAIERVRVDPGTLEPRVRVIGTEAWSDETAFGGTPVSGIAGSGIIEAIAELFLAGVITTDGVIDGALAARTDRIVPDGRTFAYVLHDGGEAAPRIVITQQDVRAIQLAKAALWAGCALLMDRAGVETIDRIRLAGAFGSHIDPRHALILGLVPDAPPDAVTSAGNAAGTGARIALLNRASRVEIERVVRDVEKVETAVEPRFQEHFVGAMGIPHATDPYARLGAVVPLPAPRRADPSDADGGRARRRRRGGRERRDARADRDARDDREERADRADRDARADRGTTPDNEREGAPG
ncbi:MAG TPA: ASKHA domain-containing protein [Actinomycetota bacterium]|nr:ASKHA domain-containing protein [Actinomycetota bacterium]